MEYRCISADCHIDLNWLPHDLFVSNASKEMKERLPYVTETPDGMRWVTKSGLNLGLANAKGCAGIFGPAGKLRYAPGKHGHRVDRMASTGLFTDASKGIFRPTTPELRLQDQDRDGIQAEVMYGLLSSGNSMTDREAAVEFYSIYNEWLADFCKYDPKRFVGLASIPSHSIEVAAAEARHAAKLGLGGLDLSISYKMTPLWNPYWDPLWKIAAETKLPVHFHTLNPAPPAPVPDELPDEIKVAALATRAAGFQLHSATILAAVIHGGALERYPTLRIVLGESGIGWIPYSLQRMDSEYEERFSRTLPIKMKPSDYWRRQCRATFQDDELGARLIDDIGVETVMWASDYPHGDTVFPDSQEYIKKQFGHLPSAIQRKITCENVGKFYGLIPA